MVLFIVAFATVAAITYVVLERSHRLKWTRYRPVHADRNTVISPFRGADDDQLYYAPDLPPRAPWRVRAIAQWSIVMGQMAIPEAP